jgi:hypothetical protein
MMIVKVQRPIATSDENQAWLIYNKSKTVIAYMTEDKIPQKMKDHYNKNLLLKAYFKAKLQPDGQLAIDHQVSERDW